jgi:hypothetical protein
VLPVLEPSGGLLSLRMTTKVSFQGNPQWSEVMKPLLIWRELDATRNSIQMAAQALYSHTQLHQKNTARMQEMLWQKGINW